MKPALFTLLLLLAGCTNQPEQYDTYVQINNASEPGKIFVLLFVRKPGHLMSRNGEVVSDKNLVTEGDGAIFPFVVTPGQSESDQRTHPHQPGKTYEAKVSARKGVGAVWIDYTGSVSKDGKKIYSSSGSELANVHL